MTPQHVVQPQPAALTPQVVRNFAQPMASPAITNRPVDAGEQNNKGNASGTTTQKQNAVVRNTAGRHAPRGSQIDILV